MPEIFVHEETIEIPLINSNQVESFLHYGLFSVSNNTINMPLTYLWMHSDYNFKLSLEPESNLSSTVGNYRFLLTKWNRRCAYHAH